MKNIHPIGGQRKLIEMTMTFKMEDWSHWSDIKTCIQMEERPFKYIERKEWTSKERIETNKRTWGEAIQKWSKSTSIDCGERATKVKDNHYLYIKNGYPPTRQSTAIEQKQENTLTREDRVDCLIMQFWYSKWKQPTLIEYEPWHEISKHVVCATSKGSDRSVLVTWVF